MGTQGEIYNVLGVKLPAQTIKQDKLYSLNGKTVATDRDYEDKAQFVNVIPTTSINLQNPTLVVRLLGYDRDMKSRHFQGQALVGYVLANESYIAHASPLPSNSVIDNLRKKLVAELREKLGYEAQASQLEIFLMFDFTQ